MAISDVKKVRRSLKGVAEQRGTSIKQMIFDAIKVSGSMRGAADHLGVSRASVQWWMARNGYRVEPRIVRARTDEQEASRS